jgi:hypothetical protein
MLVKILQKPDEAMAMIYFCECDEVFSFGFREEGGVTKYCSTTAAVSYMTCHPQYFMKNICTFIIGFETAFLQFWPKYFTCPTIFSYGKASDWKLRIHLA